MVGQSLRLFRVFGIDVGIHVSWLLIVALMTWSLALGYFPQVVDGLSEAQAWILGAAGALLLFVSVLVHELAHSLVAKARGLEARSITLFLFGGVSTLGGEARSASTEFVVAIVGPLASFVLAALLFGASLAIGPETPVGALATYLWFVNALLGVFNLVPGFPLDGGRVLRAIAWNRTGSMRRATEIAVRVGQLVSYGFLAWGVFQVLEGNLIGGLWIAAIGWFLNGAAASTLQQVIVDQRLAGLRVRDVVRPDSTAVLPGEPLEEVVERVLVPGNRRAVPVVDGRLVGILTLTDIRAVPAERRAAVLVGEVMGGRDGLVTVRPDDSLRDALEALGRGDFEQVPVADPFGRPIGLLTRADIIRAIQIREALSVGGSDGRDGPVGD